MMPLAAPGMHCRLHYHEFIYLYSSVCMHVCMLNMNVFMFICLDKI